MNQTLKKSLSMYTAMLYGVLALAVALAIIYFIAEQNVFGLIMLGAIVMIAVVAVIGIMAFRKTLHDKVLNDCQPRDAIYAALGLPFCAS